MSAGAVSAVSSPVAGAVTADAQKLEVPEDLSWIHRYRRRLLDFLGASQTVDLDAVNIVSGYEAPYQYSEHTGGGGYFSIDVYWQEMEPRKGPFSKEADFEGPFERYAQLTNEQVAQFLGSLESPA